MLALCTGPLKYVELPFYYLQVRFFNSIWKTQKPILTVNDSQLLCCLSQQRLQEARNLLEKMPGRSSHTRVVYWTSILTKYWRVGFVDEARALLDIMPERNIVSYNAMLAGYVQWGRLSEAWKLFEEMPERNVVSWTSMLCGYADTGMIREARRLFEEMPERNVVSWNAMIVGLIRNGDLDGAKRVFAAMPVRSVVSWNAMIAGLVENGRVKEARMLFEEMDDKNVITWTTLICGHCREGEVRDGYSLFRRMPGRNVVSWTAMISGFTWNGLYEEALLLFLEMKSNSNVKPNAEAYISLAYACTGVGFLCFGKQLHAQIIVNGLEYDDYDGRLCKSLIHMYSSFGIMDSADHIFNKKSCNFDLHSCNHMIDGYVRTGQLEKAESLFNSLPDRNKITWTSMIYGYFSAGLLQKACYLFYSMPDKDAVAWTSMISGHVQNELFAEAACLFSEMKAKCVSPLTSTYAILLGATGAVAYLEYGKQLHSMLVKTMTGLHLIVNNSLISMYAKCGEVEDAHRIFTSMISKDIISWNTMIMGFSHHGLAKAALQTFEAMLETETQLDSVTFLGILSACSNAGLVSKGLDVFNTMSDVYAVQPSMEHYICVINLLGRAGKLKEAEEFIMGLPFRGSQSHGIWGALLGLGASSFVEGSADIAKRAAKRLLELDPSNSPAYVALCNICAVNGEHIEEQKLRREMDIKGVRKVPGCSWITLNGRVHVFLSGDKLHAQTTM